MPRALAVRPLQSIEHTSGEYLYSLFCYCKFAFACSCVCFCFCVATHVSRRATSLLASTPNHGLTGSSALTVPETAHVVHRTASQLPALTPRRLVLASINKAGTHVPLRLHLYIRL